MVAILRRGLFWRVYLTLLGSLALVALLAALVWRHVAEQPMPMAPGAPNLAVSALMPPADAPLPQTEAVVVKLSAALHEHVTLLDAAGRPVASALNGRVALPQPAAEMNRQAGMPGAWRLHLTDGRNLFVEHRLRLSNGGPHILAVLLAVASAIGLAAYPVVSRLTGRLERLRISLDAWGSGQLDARAIMEGRDEIAAVAASFNTAADRVEALLAAHKALLAHASHELRSPLTRLRMAAEMFVQAPDPALRADIIADIAELDGLVEEILLASRLDHATDLPEREAVDLLGLVAEEAARAGASVLPVEPGSSFEVEGSPRWLRRMIRNLIENAAKHGRRPIEVRLTRSNGGASQATLVVHDHGPGIPEDDRERVFEPFYRPAGRAEAAGSWGLGLSIVRQIAERHGGRVRCTASPDGGRFIVEIPL